MVYLYRSIAHTFRVHLCELVVRICVLCSSFFPCTEAAVQKIQESRNSGSIGLIYRIDRLGTAVDYYIDRVLSGV